MEAMLTALILLLLAVSMEPPDSIFTVPTLVVPFKETPASFVFLLIVIFAISESISWMRPRPPPLTINVPFTATFLNVIFPLKTAASITRSSLKVMFCTTVSAAAQAQLVAENAATNSGT